MNITKDGIVCYNRSEIVAAHDYIKNILKRRTVIKLAAPFLPWTESAIAIDTAFVSIDGSFVELDATKATTSSGAVPPTLADGAYPTGNNYLFRFYNSTLDNNMSTGTKVAIRDLRVVGPGGNTDFICFKWMSQLSGNVGMGDLSTYNVTTTSFGAGDYYSSNSYIIHHYARDIFRCRAHVYLPSQDQGISGSNKTVANAGEGIHYYGGNLSGGSGTAIVSGNDNADTRFFGTSIDYLGKVCFINGGKVDLMNCHIELVNGAFGSTGGSRLTGVPFELSSNASARLLVTGGSMGCWVEYQEVSAWVSAGLQSRVTFRDIALSNIRPAIPDADNPTNAGLATRNPFKIGAGRFIHENLMTPYYNGNGNDTVWKGLSPSENAVVDPGFDNASLPSWYILTATDGITGRLTSANLDLTQKTNDGSSGTTSLSCLKKGGNDKRTSAGLIMPTKEGSNYHFSLKWKTLQQFTADFRLRFRVDYVNFNYSYDTVGTPIFNKTQSGNVREISLNGISPDSGFRITFCDSANHSAPSWATHAVFVVDLGGMAAGTILLDDLEFYNF